MGTDLLRWPAIGTFLRWRHARVALQLVLLAAAAAIVLHGLFGPRIAPANAATVLTWVHYRGLLVVALLAAGNFFCMGCPLVLARDAARRLHRPVRGWPRRLRTKWAALALFVLILFAYELFDLWALPAATASLVLAYFGAAVGIDVVFTGATFCKYLCPVGQFSFIASPMSPLEVRVRDQTACSACRTCDCIKGRPRSAPAARQELRGCELRLFLPQKVGNLDCTFCLDCVRACPHDNVALGTRLPGVELLDARRRSGIGRLAGRRDIAALAILFLFAGLLNAAGMIAPMRDAEGWAAQVLGITSEAAVLAIVFGLGLGVAPLLMLGGAAVAARAVARAHAEPAARVAMRYAYALVPLGFGVWVAHYGFHLLTAGLTVAPVLQSAARDALGWAVLGTPAWGLVGVQPGTVFPAQVGFVLLGAFGSLAVAYGIAEREHPAMPLAAAAPWAAVIVLLAAVALWVFAQPMEMRGTLFAG